MSADDLVCELAYIAFVLVVAAIAGWVVAILSLAF